MINGISHQHVLSYNSKRTRNESTFRVLLIYEGDAPKTGFARNLGECRDKDGLRSYICVNRFTAFKSVIAS